MTVIFDVEELRQAKREHPDRIFFLGDREKSPQKIVGKWKQITTQTPEELEELIKETQNGSVEAWNWGIKTGQGIAALDWDWEFLAYNFCRYFKERAKTETYRTANKGYRMLYKTTEKENASPYKKTLHMEVENMGYAVLGGYAIDIEGKKSEYKKELDYPIKEDNTIIADVKVFLAEHLKRYDFLSYKCVNAIVDRKHIKLEHTQRLAILQFMLSKDFPDEEIHAFFTAVYDAEGKQDYVKEKTQTQINSGRDFKKGGGKPHPCTAKTNAESGHISVPLYQVFGFDAENCKGCIRKKSKTKTEKQEAKEAEIAQILEELNAQFTFKTPKDLEELHYYEEGIYKKAEYKIKELLEAKLGAKGYTYYIEEIIRHLERSSYVEREEFNKYIGLVPVQNGLLDLTTHKLQDFNPDLIFTFKLNVKFDATKKKNNCPHWTTFLNQILPKDDQILLQEEMGYCILPAMPKHKIFWWYGGGRNGKGRVITTLESIFGKENCSYLELREFDGEHRFALPPLYGKLVNISSEPNTAKDLQTSLLKKITGEDTLDAEVKNKQQRLKFKNIAKPIILGNRFPKVSDTTLAFQDRRIILEFPKEFIGKNQVDNIEKTWLSNPDEVSAIFNWMLQGLRRLIKQNDFTQTKSSIQSDIEFKRTSDSIGAWIAEKTVFDIDGFIERKDAYDNYKNYADGELEINPEGDVKFYTRLRNTPRIREVQRKKEGRGFMGIRFKIEKDEKDEKDEKTLENDEKTLENDEKNEKNDEKEEKTLEKKQSTPILKFIPVLTVQGICGICGIKKELSYKDRNGNFVCAICQKEAFNEI